MSLSNWLCVALDVALGATELRARFRELRLGLRQRDGERARVDFKEHFVLADHRALAVVPLHEVTGHLGPDLAVRVAIERRDPFAGDLDRLGHDLNHRNRRRGSSGRGGRGLVFRAAVREHRGRGHH
jgi:hypothetical protein